MRSAFLESFSSAAERFVQYSGGRPIAAAGDGRLYASMLTCVNKPGSLQGILLRFCYAFIHIGGLFVVSFSRRDCDLGSDYPGAHR